MRNKPVEPPKKPVNAPFFLPSLPSLSGEVLFKPSEPMSEEKETKTDEVQNNDRKLDRTTSQFLQLLQSSAKMKNCVHLSPCCILFFIYELDKMLLLLFYIGNPGILTILHFAVSTFTDYIKALSPSTLDMELRLLQIIDEDDQQELEKRPEFISIELLLDYFIHEIASRNNFEFVQAVIRLFLKVWLSPYHICNFSSPLPFLT